MSFESAPGLRMAFNPWFTQLVDSVKVDHLAPFAHAERMMGSTSGHSQRVLSCVPSSGITKWRQQTG